MTKWLPGGGRVRSARFDTAQGAGRGNAPRFRDRYRIAAAGVPTDFSGPTRYRVGLNEAWRLTGRHLTSQFLLGDNGVLAGDGHFELIPHDGGATVWESPNTSPLHASTSRCSGPKVNAAGTYAYCAFDGDGTVGANGDRIAARIDMADGSLDYNAASEDGGGSGATNSCDVALDETNDRFYFDNLKSGDEIKCHVASTGAAAGVSCNDGGLGSLGALEVSPDGDFLIAGGDAEYIAQWATSGLSGLGNLFDGYSTDRLDIGVGGDTVLEFATFARLDQGATFTKARDGSNTIWVTGGYSNSDDPYLMQYDPDEATVAARAITETDVSSDAGYVDSGTNHCPDHDVGPNGWIYVLVVNGATNADYDVVVYDTDGTTRLFSFVELGLTILDHTTYGLAQRIAVSEDNYVAVTTRDGWEFTYAMNL